MDPENPGWHWSESELRDLADATAQLLTQVLTEGAQDPVTRRPSRQLLEAWSTQAWVEEGVDAGDLLVEFAETIAPYPFGNAHPRFAAWVNSPPHPLGVTGAALAAAMNPSVAGGQHSAVHLERQVVRWFAELVGWAPGFAGQLVSGGSAATLTALAVARRKALARNGHDDRRDGLTGIAAELVVYATEEAHSCVTKAVELLGIGSAHIRRIATDTGRRLDPGHLDRLLIADIGGGKLPVAVIASAGTVNTGVVDPIDQVAQVCRRHGVWLHVDGAYGGPAVLLLDEWSTVRTALAQADSIALDPHKWLYTPVDAGLILLRDGAAARDTFSLVPPYLRTSGDADEPVWFSEYGLEQTRPFRALKVWLLLKHLGKSGYRQLISRDILVANVFRQLLEQEPDFEVLGHGLSIVCFRHLVPGLTEPELDEHNANVTGQLQSAGRAFLSTTRLDGRLALRGCIVNPGTTRADLVAIIAEIRRCAAIEI